MQKYTFFNDTIYNSIFDIYIIYKYILNNFLNETNKRILCQNIHKQI